MVLNHAGLKDMIQSMAAKLMVTPNATAVGPDHFCIRWVRRTSPVRSCSRLLLKYHLETNPQNSMYTAARIQKNVGLR